MIQITANGIDLLATSESFSMTSEDTFKAESGANGRAFSPGLSSKRIVSFQTQPLKFVDALSYARLLNGGYEVVDMSESIFGDGGASPTSVSLSRIQAVQGVLGDRYSTVTGDIEYVCGNMDTSSQKSCAITLSDTGETKSFNENTTKSVKTDLDVTFDGLGNISLSHSGAGSFDCKKILIFYTQMSNRILSLVESSDYEWPERGLFNVVVGGESFLAVAEANKSGAADKKNGYIIDVTLTEVQDGRYLA